MTAWWRCAFVWRLQILAVLLTVDFGRLDHQHFRWPSSNEESSLESLIENRSTKCVCWVCRLFASVESVERSVHETESIIWLIIFISVRTHISIWFQFPFIAFQSWILASPLGLFFWRTFSNFRASLGIAKHLRSDRPNLLFRCWWTTENCRRSPTNNYSVIISSFCVYYQK